jgi:hypothetical protein
VSHEEVEVAMMQTKCAAALCVVLSMVSVQTLAEDSPPPPPKKVTETKSNEPIRENGRKENGETERVRQMLRWPLWPGKFA